MKAFFLRIALWVAHLFTKGSTVYTYVTYPEEGGPEYGRFTLSYRLVKGKGTRSFDPDETAEIRSALVASKSLNDVPITTSGNEDGFYVYCDNRLVYYVKCLEVNL